jgi:serine/threonine protein kinase
MHTYTCRISNQFMALETYAEHTPMHIRTHTHACTCTHRCAGSLHVMALEVYSQHTTYSDTYIHTCTCTHRCTGSLRFMAPEVYRQEGNYTSKVDIYLLSMIMYNLTTGVEAFEGAIDGDKIATSVAYLVRVYMYVCVCII